MAAHAITTDFYDKLVQAFRLGPGNVALVVRQTGCSRRTAEKAWEFGWPRLPWARPIRVVFREEQEAARVQLMQAEDAAREKAIEERRRLSEESIMGLKAELSLIATGRLGAAKVLGGWMYVADVLRQQLMRVRDQLTVQLATPGNAVDVEEVLEMTRKHMLIGRYAAQMVQVLQQVDKLQRGEPQSILKVEQAAAAQMPLEEAVHTIELAHELVEQSRQDGWLTVERYVPENQRVIVEPVAISGESSVALIPVGRMGA